MSGPLGGTTLSAGLADAQAQLQQALGADSGAGDLAALAAAYRASGGGPVLSFLGINPFQVLATGAFHTLYWSTVVILLGVVAVIAMQQSLLGRQTMRARHPLASLAQANFRLLVGAVTLANVPLLYAFAVTVNGAVSRGLQAVAAQSMQDLLRAGSLGALTFAQARADAVRRAADRRVLALYPAGAARGEMAALAGWYNALAAAAGAPDALPALDPAQWDPSVPDDRAVAYIGRNLVQRFAPLLQTLASLPPETTLEVAFPAGRASALPPLSAALAAEDAQAASALAQASVPANAGLLESARRAYAAGVQEQALAYLDRQLLPLLGASPSLAQRAKAWFSDQVERAAAAAGGWAARWRDLVDWMGRAVGVVLTRAVAFCFTLGVRVLMEVDLFVLTLALPLWLLPATEEAFYGVLRSLVSLSVMVPAYQFVMLLVDALMGLVLKYLIFGPAAAGGSLAASAGYGTAAAIAAIASGGELIALASFCYVFAYLFLAVYAALQTPRLVHRFVRGAGAGAAFLAAFGTGLVAGAASAVATAAVAAG
ncbi:MAG TPA: hypothetical protein VHC86_12640, partial [Opitutaceae bacterium]|nr:hypothetical protein [Opitutaceae bacterium]